MGDEQPVRYVHEHMQPLPNGRGQIMQPEVMARRSHEKQNQQRKESERLKGEVRNAGVACIADEQADQRIEIPQCVELEKRKRTVRQSENEHGDAQVPAIVKERQESPV